MEKPSCNQICTVVKKFVAIISVLAIIIAIPILIDLFLGSGFPGIIYPGHNFAAENWFSFLGSYFPSMLIGSLTIYQTYIIREKDRQYNELLLRYLYIPDQNAKVYQYSPEDNMIGEWKYGDFLDYLQKEVTEQERETLEQLWKNGYIIDCYLHNTGTIGMAKVKCTSVKWSINSSATEEVQEDGRIMTVSQSMGGAKYKISVFWAFRDYDGKFAKAVGRCMENNPRRDSAYSISDICLEMIFTNDEKKTYTMFMKFKMKAFEGCNPYELQSIEEHFYPGEK